MAINRNHQGATLYGDWAAVTPDDNNALSVAPCNGLYVGGAGDVAIKSVNGNSVTFTAVPAGTVLPVRAQLVLATGTTATGIVALY